MDASNKMEERESQSIKRAKEFLRGRVEEAQDIVIILEGIEKSREEYPEPKVLTSLKRTWQDAVEKRSILPKTAEEYLKTDELLIRGLFAVKKSISPELMGRVFEFSDDAPIQTVMKNQIWYLVNQKIIELDSERKLKLSEKITLE